ncbi:alpha-actinin [Sorochytrium milnesiophthora]
MASSSLRGSRNSLGSINELSRASQATVQDTSRVMDKTWESVQKKTFTKWVNTKLQSKGVAVQDLTSEFGDGVALIQLLEVIGDESLGKYNKTPKMRIQKVENLNRALAFIKQRGVNLTNIGAEDIVDGNEKLVLGMIWTIILRFTIADISEEGLTAKEGLLLWCQRKTAPYAPDVQVKDFTFSWQDGLAFCALIHRHRPDLIDFHSLNKSAKHENMALAFDVAQQHLHIPKLLDVEDVIDLPKPDERSIMTYVAQYFHAFSALDKVEVAGRRVAKFAEVMASVFDMEHDYEQRSRALLSNVADVQSQWAASSFDGSYTDAKRQGGEFDLYKSTTKRSWVAEKRDLDTLLGNIRTKLKTYNLSPYNPPAGLTPEDLSDKWSGLLKAEGERKRHINAKIKEIKDNLQLAYANKANSFQEELNTISVTLARLQGDLDSQLQTVQSLQSSVPEMETHIGELTDMQRACLEAGIEENEHTIYSAEDLAFDFGLVKQSLQKKAGFIENQRVARQMTNLTPQQLEEFETTFRQFDKDLSNSLSRIEFKASLAGLGIAYDDQEFDRVFAEVCQHRPDVSFEQFVHYMRSITEDTTSIEQLASAFKALASGKSHVTEVDLQIAHLPPQVVSYLQEAMPKSESGGYDYSQFLQTVFKQ